MRDHWRQTASSLISGLGLILPRKERGFPLAVENLERSAVAQRLDNLLGLPDGHDLQTAEFVRALLKPPRRQIERSKIVPMLTDAGAKR